MARFTIEWFQARNVQRTVFHVRDLYGDASEDDWARVGNAIINTLYLPPDDPFQPPELASYMGEEVGYAAMVVRYALGAAIVRTLRFPILFLPFLPGPREPCMPGNSTFAVQWFTGERGRRGIGRTYVPCLSLSVTQAGDRDRVRVDAANAIAGSLRRLIPAVVLAGRDAYQMRLVVYHRDGISGRGGAERWSTPIIGCRWTDRLIDSQRGRVPGHVYH